jgi:hypothetical protein
MAILEAAALQTFPQVKQQDPAPYVTKRIVRTAKGALHGSRLTLAELWERSRRLGPKSRNESSTIVRALRDGRYSR